MAYDEELAQRVRDEVLELPDCIEKKMFGGIGFILRGNMACGVIGDDLVVRVGPDQYQNALAQKYTKVFDMTGKPMTGWVLVTPEGTKKDEDLKAWVRKGAEFALSLPPK